MCGGLTIQSWAAAALLEIEQDGLHGEAEGTDSGGAGNVRIPSIQSYRHSSETGQAGRSQKTWQRTDKALCRGCSEQRSQRSLT